MTTGDHGGSSTHGDLAALIAQGRAVGHWSLDPAASSVRVHEKHFWGAITVHGTFGQLSGEATVGADGTIAGRLTMAAATLSTKNVKRDTHLRSPEFFDAERHPSVVVDVVAAQPTTPGVLTCRGSLEAAGHSEPIEFTAMVVEASPDAVTLQGELTIDRRKFSMAWSPLGMASRQSRGTVLARFVRD